MAKIKYLRRTHDAAPGDEKVIDDASARVLVLTGHAQYVTEKPQQKKQSKKAEKANVEPVPEERKGADSASEG